VIKAEIEAGVCGLSTTIEATSTDGMLVALKIESDCPQIQAMAAELDTVSAMEELFVPQKQTRVLQLAAEQKLHTTCIVPVGILKTVEAASNMALPTNSCISLSRKEA
jgi:hypothetical protein